MKENVSQKQEVAVSQNNNLTVFLKHSPQEFYYISDIHLDNQFNESMSFNDKLLIAEEVARKIINEYKNENAYLLFAGDLVRNINIAKIFYQTLVQGINPKKIVVVLGNHEFYDETFNLEGNSRAEAIINSYDEMLSALNINFLNDDLMVVYKDKIEILHKKDVLTLTDSQLKDFCKDKRFLILGSFGMGYREEYKNNYLDFDEESLKINVFCNFKLMYEKIARVFRNERVICLTHCPKNVDKNKDIEEYEKNWIYVYGHTHENFYINNSEKTIYADNQIVNAKYIRLKKFTFEKQNFRNYFKMYLDGIHNIKHREYINLYSNLGIFIDFNNKDDEIYMVKKGRFVAFFLKSKKFNKLYLLEGGSLRDIKNQDLDYYYENLQLYAEKIVKMLLSYETRMLQLSKEVKKFGGEGTIHGCIVNIDFYNHIYLNPWDSTITPYFAKVNEERFVFKNVPSLLKYKCSELFCKFKKKLLKSSDNNLNIFLKDNQKISKETIKDTSPIYSISHIVRKMQYVYEHGIVRLWNENILKIPDENLSLNDRNLLLGFSEE